MRKIILAGIGLLLILGALYGAKLLVDSKNKPKPVKEKVIKTVITDTVINSNIKIVVPANGNLVAKQRLEIYAEVQGIFKAGNKLFKPGQEYKRGEALIRMDASEHYASVQSAKSNLYNSIASIMPDLRLDFPDVFEKWQNYLSGFDISKTTPKLPEMTSDKENYFITGRGIVTSYYNVKNLEQRLTKYTITAPFSGILTEALVTEGSLIRSGQKLGEFINPSIYEMEVAISKTYSSLLRVGEPVALNNLENTESYIGKVSRINGSVDATTQTVTAYIEVKHANLKEGMYLEANLDAKEEQDAYEMDRNLLQDGNQVFVVNNNVLELINVTPVYFSDSKVVIKGIPNNTVVLKKSVPGAYSGMRVKSANN
ncbi:efflux RND transporter periplasmic adaptor subunit [Neotamlana laminarinivorans]|uniref:HlyD family efflux transporter periplasmic adaptor subunit n=1 Tax=Neotamlana laminarinivorans TaxID=2883124 RepID=A0A9X1I1N7_9FLAO|nr:HlyD family efflux transporter periplasmic adaptor subunit [Tamlana laminarinivorans]MCB4799340.1 HlyD family efflux transporter periplasmic adaptor subunit [Tamlana laminarinivorans]